MVVQSVLSRLLGHEPWALHLVFRIDYRLCLDVDGEEKNGYPKLGKNHRFQQRRGLADGAGEDHF